MIPHFCVFSPSLLANSSRAPARRLRLPLALCQALLWLVASAASASPASGEAALPSLSPRLSTSATPWRAPRGLAAREDTQRFIDEMSRKHGFDRRQLESWFALVEMRQGILDKITRPAEKTKPWRDYRRIFLDQQRIDNGVAFWRSQLPVLMEAQQRYGVDPAIIVAIIGVETRYGRVTGRDRVLEALGTIAFGHPPRAPFFRSELEHYLLLSREEGIDPLILTGSYAGAMGIPQFMPSSYRRYAVDFNGDGRRDLWRDPVDAVGSVANYLAVHGWRADGPVALRAQVAGSAFQAWLNQGLKPQHSLAEWRGVGVVPIDAPSELDDNAKAILLALEGDSGVEYWLGLDNFYAITRYNHSPLYAMAVYQLSRAIRADRRP